MNQRNQIEKELKLCLSEVHYMNLCEYLLKNSSLIDIHEQCNVYLETEDDYFANHCEMLRLRETENFWTLTHKSRIKVNDGEFSSHELETDLGYFEGAITELTSKVQQLEPWNQLKPLIVQGQLLNTRHEFNWKDFTLELDRSQFSNERIDFELECETTEFERLRTSLAELFEQLKIPWEPQATSKYKRFLESLDLNLKNII